MTTQLHVILVCFSILCTIAKGCMDTASDVLLVQTHEAGALADCRDHAADIFRRQGTAVTIPASAKLQLTGHNWYCNIMIDGAARTFVMGEHSYLAVTGYTIVHIGAPFNAGDRARLKVGKHSEWYSHSDVTIGADSHVAMADFTAFYQHGGGSLVLGTGVKLTLNNWASIGALGSNSRIQLHSKSKTTLGLKTTLTLGEGCHLSVGRNSIVTLQDASTMTLALGATVTLTGSSSLKLGPRSMLTVASNTACVIMGPVPAIMDGSAVTWNKDYEGGNVRCAQT